jgi:hypothetical protein
MRTWPIDDADLSVKKKDAGQHRPASFIDYFARGEWGMPEGRALREGGGE